MIAPPAAFPASPPGPEPGAAGSGSPNQLNPSSDSTNGADTSFQAVMRGLQPQGPADPNTPTPVPGRKAKGQNELLVGMPIAFVPVLLDQPLPQGGCVAENACTVLEGTGPQIPSPAVETALRAPAQTQTSAAPALSLAEPTNAEVAHALSRAIPGEGESPNVEASTNPVPADGQPPLPPESTLPQAGADSQVPLPAPAADVRVPSNKDDDSGRAEIDAARGSPGSIHLTEPRESHARVEEVRPPAPLADQVQEHMTAHLARLREHGRVEVQMNLRPPELGHVRLHLALNDGEISVRFLVQNDGAQSALDQQLEPMRVRFLEMGFSLGEFDVRRDGSSPDWQSPANADGAEAWRQIRQPTEDTAPKRYLPVMNPDALVDVIA